LQNICRSVKGGGMKAQSSEEHTLPSLSLVFGYIAIKELRIVEDRFRILARLGFGNVEIATICCTTPAVNILI